MSNLSRLLPLALLSTLAMAGCAEETVSSENIKTGGIVGLFEVTARSDSSSTARATLVVGGDQSNTYVTLDNGDNLTATAGSETKTLTTAGGPGRYEANFATGAAGEEFSIALNRPDDTDALGNSGLLPAPFAFTELPTGTPSRKTDAVTIKWDNGEAGSLELEVEGDCIFDESFKPASGSTEFTISADKLRSTGVNEEDKETCDLTVTLTRTSSGSVDPALDNDSRFRLHQVRSTTFASAP